MNKILKAGLISTATVLGVAVAGAAYLAATFNPNDYKEKIIQAVQDSKHRTLHLDGDISLSFFPNIGAKLSRVSLSEFKSDQEFAAMESARVSLALLPLFSKQIIVNEVALSGLHGTLIKHKDGTSNIDDLIAKKSEPAPASQPVNFDIAKVVIAKTDLTYVDELSGAQYAIKDLQLTTGRIANGVPAKIAMSAAVQANQPKLSIHTELKTTLTFDLDKQSYQLADLDLNATGAALDMTQLHLQASGNASANLSTQEFSANKLAVKVSGVKGKENFSAELSAPDLNLTKDHYAGSKITLNASLDAAFGKLDAALSVPAITGSAEEFKIDNLTLDAQMQQPEQTFKVKLSTLLAGNMTTQQFDLSNLDIALNATGDKLPNKAVSSTMKGNVLLNLKQQSVQANLSGGLLQSQLRAKLDVNGFAQPAIHFDVDVDQFDADLYLPKKSADAPKAAAAQPEQPLDLSALRTLNLDGSLRVGALKVANVKVNQLRVVVQAHKGIVNVNPLSANLYQGSTNGSISVNAQATPSIAIKQNLTGIDIATLGKDAANFDMLEGKGNVSVNLTMQGNKVSEMKRALNGTASLNLADGAVKGINIAKKMRDVKSMFGAKSDTQAANKAEKTDFSEMKASFKITNGVAHNDDLSMKSPLLRLSGSGDINIGNDSINYLAKATLAKTLEGQGGADSVGGMTVPVRVSGPFVDLKYSLDFGSMVSDQTKQKVDAAKTAVKQQVDVKKEEAKTKLQDQLKGGLKGLFK
jgi:AsmA protein